MALNDAIKEAREAAGLTQEQLALAIGAAGQSTIGNYERGKNEPNFETLQKISTVCGTTVIALYAAATGVAREERRPYNDEKSVDFERVPVTGRAQLGDDGYWESDDHPKSTADGYVRFSSRDRDAYAVQASGDSMKPRIRHGEYLICEPNTRVRLGDEVRVRTADGRSMIKILQSASKGFVVLESVNNHFKPITLPMSEIEYMHYVAGIAKPALFSPG